MTPEQRSVLNDIIGAALGAVAPDRAVHRHVRRNDETLYIGDVPYDLAGYERVFVVGAGKGAAL